MKAGQLFALFEVRKLSIRLIYDVVIQYVIRLSIMLLCGLKKQMNRKV